MSRTVFQRFTPPVVAFGFARRPDQFAMAGGFFFPAMALKLLTLVWEKAPHKDGALLLLLALADWADDDGVAFPSVEGLAFKARMGERHARRLLRDFEAEGLITTEDRGKQHKTNRYRISIAKFRELPDRLKCPPSDLPDRTPVSAQTGSGSPPDRLSIAPDPSGTANEPPMIPAKEDALSLEAGQFVIWFVALLMRTNAPTPRMSPTIRAAWAKSYELLRRRDGKEQAEIMKVCEWARTDEFWAQNFYAPTKLRERKDGISRYDLFLSRMNRPTNGNARTQRLNPRSDIEQNNIEQYRAFDRMASGGV